MLTTAGKLLFAGDGAGNIVAFDPGNGKPLWHSRVGNVSRALRKGWEIKSLTEERTNVLQQT
jgi:outer membrane protein assembly factor BamB